MLGPSCRSQPKRVVHPTSRRRQVYDCLGALLVSAFAIPAAEGAGTVEFSTARTIDDLAVGAVSVIAADIDGDGDNDIVAAMYGGHDILWYQNLDGKGTFAEGDEISDLFNPTSIAVADVDGDGYPDVVASFYRDSAQWFKNVDGLGGFSAEQAVDTEGDDYVDYAQSVAVADVDGDGNMDVISASLDDRVTWFQNTDGAGTFAVGVDLTEEADGSRMVIAADVDGDGDTDVIGVSENDNRLTWYENSDGEGGFNLGVDLAVDVGEAIYVTAADLDGDDDLDVVSAGYQDGRFVWYENTDGAGTFAAGQDIDLLDSARSVVAADLDGDGDVDLVACDQVGGRIVWYENTDGLGSFSAAIDIALDVGVNEVVAADIDGDGDLDLVSASGEEDLILWYENLMVSDGDSTSMGSAASSSGSSTTATPVPAEVTTPAPVVPPETTSSGPDTPAPVVPPGTTSSGPDESPEGGATPAPSSPQRATTSEEDSPADTPAPGVATPPTEAGSVTDAEGGSTNKWADAGWEIAVTVIGGLLVTGLGALLVAWIHKNRHQADQHAKNDSAIINIHNTVHGADANARGESDATT